jgi:hypothetical protein
VNRPRITRRRSAAVAVLAAGAVAGGAVVLGGSSDGTSSATAASTSTATTVIKRQDLVEVQTEDGTLGYSDTRSVVNRLSGTVTWLAPVGSTVHADHALYKVDGSPVILMNGSLPAYRTLSSGVTDGVDVRQLEGALRAHGYDPGHAMTVDGSWSAATTAAVRRWQQAHGLSQTGEIALGRVVFLPGARRISSTTATLGGSAAGSGGGSGASTTAAPASSSAGATMVYADYQVAQADDPATTSATTPAPATTTTPAPKTTTPAEATPPAQTTTTPKATTATPSAGAQGPASAAPAAPSRGGGGASSSATAAPSGGGAPSSGASSAQATTANKLMTTTSTKRVVTVALATTKSALATAGQQVTVTLPSGSNVHGRISSVGKVATAPASDTASGSGSSSSSTPATIKVTIRLSAARTGLDQAPVTVRFEQSRRKQVLAIPVTALLAQPGGTSGVQLVQADGTRRTVAVKTGLYTSGYVEITGAGLQPGQRVTNAAVQ